MDLKKHEKIFNNIAFIYNWFFSYQVRSLDGIFDRHLEKLELSRDGEILDIGCGTGAYSHVLGKRGFHVTGVDLSRKMVDIARNKGLDCRHGNVLEGLGFEDNSFDLVLAGFVAHGLDRDKRKELYKEASRLSRGQVLFSDYSPRRRFHVSFIEYLEDGDYFNFIKEVPREMEEFFARVEVIPVNPGNHWYLCTSEKK